ncbi:melibiase [Planoprotostelium fungivorum]|uniref:Alpha-galactosidase n=1 Tax=Planoprotostelium fungivorum TaxID=1890364 RepID=A0A2P6NH00_9EUKA|nr:melibiase [Planoprotostelium fungivorum]
MSGGLRCFLGSGRGNSIIFTDTSRLGACSLKQQNPGQGLLGISVFKIRLNSDHLLPCIRNPKEMTALLDLVFVGHQLDELIQQWSQIQCYAECTERVWEAALRSSSTKELSAVSPLFPLLSESIHEQSAQSQYMDHAISISLRSLIRLVGVLRGFAENNRSMAEELQMEGCDALSRDKLQLLLKHQYAIPFRQPVDPVALDIPDYPTIVRRPMDLGTISKRLNDGGYLSVPRFISDVRLVFSNCRLYNAKTHPIMLLCDSLSELFEAQVAFHFDDRYQIISNGAILDIQQQQQILSSFHQSKKKTNAKKRHHAELDGHMNGDRVPKDVHPRDAPVNRHGGTDDVAQFGQAFDEAPMISGESNTSSQITTVVDEEKNPYLLPSEPPNHTSIKRDPVDPHLPREEELTRMYKCIRDDDTITLKSLVNYIKQLQNQPLNGPIAVQQEGDRLGVTASDVNARQGPYRETSLHLAVRAGNLYAIKYLCIHPFIEPRIRDGRGMTPLESAVDLQLPEEIVEALQWAMNKVAHLPPPPLPSLPPLQLRLQRAPTMEGRHCTSCHICTSSLMDGTTRFKECSTCPYVFCQNCFGRHVHPNWSNISSEMSWKCAVCLGNCVCHRCVTVGPPVWFGCENEKWRDQGRRRKQLEDYSERCHLASRQDKDFSSATETQEQTEMEIKGWFVFLVLCVGATLSAECSDATLGSMFIEIPENELWMMRAQLCANDTCADGDCDIWGANYMSGNQDWAAHGSLKSRTDNCWSATENIIDQCYRLYGRLSGSWTLGDEHYSLGFEMKSSLKPYMGWSSWSLQATKHAGYGFNWLNEKNVMAHIDIVGDKLRKFGWEYINLDSGWSGGIDEFGRYVGDQGKFPSGIKALADYAHSKNLKLGLYLIPGADHGAYDQNLLVKGTNYRFKDFVTTQDANAFGGSRYKIDYSKPGAQEYINSVADLLAEWGVDFLKLDAVVPGSSITGDTNVDARPDVIAWHKAIEQCGRPIWLTLSWGLPPTELKTWRPNARAWRIQQDVESYGDDLTNFGDVLRNVKTNADWIDRYGVASGYQDMDSLLVVGPAQFLGLNQNERRSMMNYWVLSASPLYLGVDLTLMDDFGYSLISNEEIIAIHQRGVPARLPGGLNNFNDQQTWFATYPEGSLAVGMFNLGGGTSEVQADWNYLGIAGSYKVRDLWNTTDIGSFDSQFKVTLDSHDSRIFLFTKI